MKSKCRLLQAKDGNQVPVVQRGEETFRLGSLYDGRYAAGRWADYYVQGCVENVILFGLGDCQIVLQLLERVPGRILVYEPEEEVYDEVRRMTVFKKIQKCQRCFLFYGGGQYDALQETMIQILNDDNVDRTALLTTPGYYTHYPDAYNRLAEMCGRICEAIRFTQGAIQRSFPTMIKNQLRNISHVKDAIPLTRLAKHWDGEVPVILVAAGPSLLKNIEQLKKVRGRAFLFCVDAALPTMMKAGIVPDLVGSVDAVKNMECFSEPGSYDIPYLVTCNSRYELVSGLTKEKVWGKDHGCTRMIFEKFGIESPHSPAQFGIAGEMFTSLIELGTKKIIMVGQDLAYSEGKTSHIGGMDEGFDTAQAIRVEGYYGKDVYSRPDWNKFRELFEEAIRRMPPGCEVINATEGGVRIHGTTQIPLCQVVEGLPETKTSLTAIFSQDGLRITPEEYEGIMKEWSGVRKELDDIKEWGYHKTFFETDYRKLPAMDMVLGGMRYLKDVPDREERFERALDFIRQSISELEGAGENE